MISVTNPGLEPLITSAQTINIQEVEKEFPSEMEES